MRRFEFDIEGLPDNINCIDILLAFEESIGKIGKNFLAKRILKESTLKILEKFIIIRIAEYEKGMKIDERLQQ